MPSQNMPSTECAVPPSAKYICWYRTAECHTPAEMSCPREPILLAPGAAGSTLAHHADGAAVRPTPSLILLPRCAEVRTFPSLMQTNVSASQRQTPPTFAGRSRRRRDLGGKHTSRSRFRRNATQVHP